MPSFVCLQDSRLAGLVRKSPSLDVVVVGSATKLSTAFGLIKGKGEIECLFIACHGYESEEYNEASNTEVRGGFGLHIGDDDMTHSNVSQWSAIKGICKNIVVYSCGSADMAPGQKAKIGDGKYLMGALAIHTESTVYAADATQYYSLTRAAYIDFGKWEGNLLRFKSDGTPPAIVSRAPYEMINMRSTGDKITDAIFG
jgi:hypothetical protein